MRYHGNSGVVQIEPVRDLTVGDDVDVLHPGSVLLQGTEGIPQLLKQMKYF